jgi:hypothetical protein
MMCKADATEMMAIMVGVNQFGGEVMGRSKIPTALLTDASEPNE